MQATIKNDLKLPKISARWVPQILNAKHKAVRGEISQRFSNSMQQRQAHFDGHSHTSGLMDTPLYSLNQEVEYGVCLLYTSRCV